MAAGPADIGITEATDTLVQSVEIERKMGIDVVRKDREGRFACAHMADPMQTFSVTVLGETGEAVGEALAMSLSQVTGGRSVVLERTHKRVNDNFNETTFSGEHYPSATVGG